jgi:hypothetical protein
LWDTGRFHSFSWTVAKTGNERLVGDVGISPERARHTSPGQRPGFGYPPIRKALKGRDIGIIHSVIPIQNLPHNKKLGERMNENVLLWDTGLKSGATVPVVMLSLVFSC